MSLFQHPQSLIKKGICGWKQDLLKEKSIISMQELGKQDGKSQNKGQMMGQFQTNKEMIKDKMVVIKRVKQIKIQHQRYGLSFVVSLLLILSIEPLWVIPQNFTNSDFERDTCKLLLWAQFEDYMRCALKNMLASI